MIVASLTREVGEFCGVNVLARVSAASVTTVVVGFLFRICSIKQNLVRAQLEIVSVMV